MGKFKYGPEILIKKNFIMENIVCLSMRRIKKYIIRKSALETGQNCFEAVLSIIIYKNPRHILT
jgi:hypothetical protein